MEQISFGNSDEIEPSWSPDGKWIAYLQSRDGWSKYGLYAVNASTDKSTLIGMVDGANYTWSTNPLRIIDEPDLPGKQAELAIPSGKALPGNKDSKLDWDQVGKYDADIDGKNELTVYVHDGPAWNVVKTYSGDWTSCYDMRANRIVALRDDGTNQASGQDIYSLHIFDCGIAQHDLPTERIYPVSSIATELTGVDPTDYEEILPLDNTCVWPHHPDEIIVQSNEHNSTVGEAAAFIALDLKSGKAKLIQDYARFVTFSPTGRYFLTAPGRDAVPYMRWRNDQVRTVWAAPLYIVDAETGKRVMLTPRTAYVDSAEWRK